MTTRKSKNYSLVSHTHAHTHLTARFRGLPGKASTRTVKPIWILLKQETVSGSGISWAICKSASRCHPFFIQMTPLTTDRFANRTKLRETLHARNVGWHTRQRSSLYLLWIDQIAQPAQETTTTQLQGEMLTYKDKISPQWRRDDMPPLI